MKITISNYLLKQKEVLKKIIEILSTDFKYVSILANDMTGTMYQTQKSETTLSDSRWCERGFVVRVFNGINYSEFSFNEISDDPESIAGMIKEKIEDSIAAIKTSSSELEKYPLIDEEAIEDSWQGEAQNPSENIDPAKIIEKLTDLKDKAMTMSDFLVDARIIFEEVKVSKMFLSIKKDLEQSYIWSQAYLIPIVRKGEKTNFLYEAFSGLKGYEILDEMNSRLSGTIKETEALLKAEPVVPGEYEVICSPKVSGLIAHEAFGHGVEMDMFVKKRAKALEYIDKPVASKKVDMHDGARSATQVSSFLFDDEGVLGTDTKIIDKGILKRGISDLLSAFKLKTVPTGNGKRESFERKAYARMTNTFFTAGTDSLDDMIASIKYGYLLENYTSGMEDPRNWGIQCVILYGQEIRDGKFTGNLISPVIMTGYVPDLLKAITMVSDDDIDLSGSGMCGKGHKEWVKTSSGGTYIKTMARLG